MTSTVYHLDPTNSRDKATLSRYSTHSIRVRAAKFCTDSGARDDFVFKGPNGHILGRTLGQHRLPAYGIIRRHFFGDIKRVETMETMARTSSTQNIDNTHDCAVLPQRSAPLRARLD